jgi:alpha-L-fucosidase
MLRKIILFLLVIGQIPAANAQQAPKPYGALPSAAQLNWHEMEMYCLIHFGVDTYTDKEWGFGDEDPKILNPVKFDAEKILSAAKAGGFKGIIVVAKHHDGLCLWPTKTTTHNISQTPWKDGKGDMIKEYQLACKKLGMQMGLYCSPWDRNNSTYGTPAYVEIYRNQIKELYANYGKIFISWHDGANGGDGYYGGANEVRKIDRTTYYGWDTNWSMIRKMQPSAAIFGDVGPDVRWVGNEEGHAGETSWATYDPQAPEPGKQPSNGFVKSELGVEGTRNGKHWMPAECDVSLRPGWFYHASQNAQVKTPQQLMDLYYKSVGRGANLDLGISPNREGLLDEVDQRALAGFGKILKTTFAVNLANGAKFEASNIRGNNKPKYGPQLLTDSDRYSYWATDDEVTSAELIVNLKGSKTFNIIRLRENIKLGQRIEGVSVDTMKDGRWVELVKATSIGANRLLRLPKAITTNKLRLTILKSPASIALSDFGLFMEPIRKEKQDAVSQAPKGLDKTKWKILSATTSEKSSYSTSLNDLMVDLGTARQLSSFTYQPLKDGTALIDKYSFYISADGKNWKSISSGEFSNIKANPIIQRVTFKTPVQTRYVRFQATNVLSGQGISLIQIDLQ